MRQGPLCEESTRLITEETYLTAEIVRLDQIRRAALSRKVQIRRRLDELNPVAPDRCPCCDRPESLDWGPICDMCCQCPQCATSSCEWCGA